jgi:hypothetical protein
VVELVEISRAPWYHKKELVPKAKLDTGFFMKPLNSFSWALALAAPLSEPKPKPSIWDHTNENDRQGWL